MKLAHAAARVSSREEAKRFYQELLGLELLKESRISPELTERIFGVHQGYDILLYQLENSQLELFVGPPAPGENPGVVHLCIWVGDREKLKTRAGEMGYKTTEIPREGNYTLIFIYDADGNVFELRD